VIENICDKDIFVEPKFTSSSPGIELRIEKENPNCSILDCKKVVWNMNPRRLFSMSCFSFCSKTQ